MSDPLIRPFVAYAPPLAWGPWVTVATHLGPATYSISASPDGSTVLNCEVRYFDASQKQVAQAWTQSVNITTGDSVATVEVRFKGVPLGSSVSGTITP